jgi:glutamine synthetase
MTAARLTIDEAQAFLDANPGVQWIDAFLFDMNGIPRGKRIRRSDLIGVVKGGVMLPTSIFIMDPLGNCVEETGRLWETGDRDHHCHLLSGTLVPIPVGHGRHAQVVMVIDAKDELDPRGVLIDQVEQFTSAGRTPVVAVELEFYVTHAGPPMAPPWSTRLKVSPTIRAGRSLSALRRWTRFLPSSMTSTGFATSRVSLSTRS